MGSSGSTHKKMPAKCRSMGVGEAGLQKFMAEGVSLHSYANDHFSVSLDSLAKGTLRTLDRIWDVEKASVGPLHGHVVKPLHLCRAHRDHLMPL